MKNDRGSATRDAVQRYCPYVEENVVMMVNCRGEAKKFECVETGRCLHAQQFGCSCDGKSKDIR